MQQIDVKLCVHSSITSDKSINPTFSLSRAYPSPNAIASCLTTTKVTCFAGKENRNVRYKCVTTKNHIEGVVKKEREIVDGLIEGHRQG